MEWVMTAIVLCVCGTVLMDNRGIQGVADDMCCFVVNAVMSLHTSCSTNKLC